MTGAADIVAVGAVAGCVEVGGVGVGVGADSVAGHIAAAAAADNVHDPPFL